MSPRPEDQEPVVIPAERLSREALLGIVDDFVLREGTDYGHADVPLSIKRAQVLAQLRAGQAVIVFDPGSETCTIVCR